jgi:preprotein translocase subunit SecA
MLKLFSKFLDLNQKELDRLSKTVAKINAQEEDTKKLKDKDFPKKTKEFIDRVESGETLEDILPEAFALVREAAWRSLGKRPYDVQLMAGVALFEGKVAEQKTGEGKTLSAVAPLYLRALTGKGAHLVTVNDFLARIGAGWNGPLFEFLGMTVGVVAQEQKSYVFDSSFSDTSHGDERLSHLKPATRKEAYAQDITYGTNNEYGFDYLRDNMVQSLDQMSQRGHYFAIVDEVDSVLIDEARTPLIISAPDTDPTDKYYKFAEIVQKLNPDTDYKVDEKQKTTTLTEHGITRLEKILGVDNLYEKDYESIHHIENALKARMNFLLDREYVIKDGQVIIVDEFTGRLMNGRRWSDGLHQAVEAKEGVAIQQESKTLATISFQNYFRMYEHLGGMTGTASTEADEFKKIYNLDVVAIPTHNPMVRKDENDIIYKTVRAKYSAIVDDIEERTKNGQPVLIGTTSIDKNEIISDLLKRKKITHNVLNAKNHESEALIISDAGKPSSVTVATNMAGRGVDIILGGAMPDKPDGMTNEQFRKSKEYTKWETQHKKVTEAGGLHVIGTERHESRRIDNQLRGRAGRQGDPGSTKFYLSLEDDLMRIFGGDQIKSLMDRMNIPEDQPIENRLVGRAIEQAQVKVESHNFDMRKSVVGYDDIVNQQRGIVYSLRNRILSAESLKEEILEKLSHQVESIYLRSSSVETNKVDKEEVIVNLMDIVPFDDASRERVKDQIEKLDTKEEVTEFLNKLLSDVYSSREKGLGDQVVRQVERFAYLSSLDKLWIEYIDQIDGLKQAVGLRGRNDDERIGIFKVEAFDMFSGLIDNIDSELARRIFRIQVSQQMPTIPLSQARTNIDTSDNQGLISESSDVVARRGQKAFASTSTGGAGNSVSQTANSQKTKATIGRNDPCWCGSGKKWKKCHYPQLPQ